MLKNIGLNINSIDFSLPEWHKEILDNRLQAISENPTTIKPLSELVFELDLKI